MALVNRLAIPGQQANRPLWPAYAYKPSAYICNVSLPEAIYTDVFKYANAMPNYISVAVMMLPSPCICVLSKFTFLDNNL